MKRQTRRKHAEIARAAVGVLAEASAVVTVEQLVNARLAMIVPDHRPNRRSKKHQKTRPKLAQPTRKRMEMPLNRGAAVNGNLEAQRLVIQTKPVKVSMVQIASRRVQLPKNWARKLRLLLQVAKRLVSRDIMRVTSPATMKVTSPATMRVTNPATMIVTSPATMMVTSPANLGKTVSVAVADPGELVVKDRAIVVENRAIAVENRAIAVRDRDTVVKDRDTVEKVKATAGAVNAEVDSVAAIGTLMNLTKPNHSPKTMGSVAAVGPLMSLTRPSHKPRSDKRLLRSHHIDPVAL